MDERSVVGSGPAGRRLRSAAAVPVVAAGALLAGCSLLRAAPAEPSQSPSSATSGVAASAPQTVAASPTVPPRPDESGCVTATEQLDNDDLGLVAVGEFVFRSLDCGAGTGLGDQLAGRAVDPQVLQTASKSGVSFDLHDTAGGTSLSMYADDGTCVITISERPRTKTLTCG
ncbi:MAG: hypothetical protein ACH36H_10730 [Candidatus Nanopelagicales bacterium]